MDHLSGAALLRDHVLVQWANPNVYTMPSGQPLKLGLTPRLESWNARDHPDQVRLREFVAHVREVVDPVAEALDGPLGLKLDVGLDDSIDPLWQRDLDNYLYPIARELPGRYVSIWGTKSRAPASYVTVGQAVATSPPPWLEQAVPRAAGGEANWKKTVRNAVSSAEELPPGPVGVQIALRIGSSRGRANMWKRTIDGLEPELQHNEQRLAR